MSGIEQEQAIEEATQWAHENGNDDSAVRTAARRFCGNESSTILEAIRRKLRELFG
jgi:hypothetical protein